MTEPIDKEQLREKILELEGISEEEKLALVRLLESQKRYGLVWEDKPEDIEQQLREQLPVLTEIKERAIIHSSPLGESEGAIPNHVLIEGDNLAALTALSYTHEGKIDVIYIDPPYNTGNKDFVYNDSFVDSEDGYRHSKWLSFMDKRLRIAKRLLSDKGVIFISIDDNEYADLKLLCDVVFGNANFCGEFIWRKKSGGGQTDAYFVTEHEFILVYQKSDVFHWIDPTDKLTAEAFSFSDERGPYNRVKLEKWGSSAHKEDRPSMYFPLKNPSGEDYYPIAPDGKDGRWRVGLPRMQMLIDNNLIEWKNNRPYEKIYYDDNTSKEKVYKSRSILYSLAETGDGTRILNDILLEKDKFNNPKPVELIQELISHNTASTILDFFAGSGTTLHATMQLNAEDSGHRQCILVTNNENNICEEVTYERNKRVIQGYTTPKGVAVEGLKKNNLRYYKTEFLPREMTFDNKQALMRASVDLLCIKENIYTEVREFCGMKFKPSLLRYYKEKDASTGSAQARQMLLIFDERVIEHIIPMIANLEGKLKVYVFSNGAYAYEDEFHEVRDKVEVCALPEAILQAYHKVLPHREEEVRI